MKILPPYFMGTDGPSGTGPMTATSTYAVHLYTLCLQTGGKHVEQYTVWDGPRYGWTDCVRAIRNTTMTYSRVPISRGTIRTAMGLETTTTDVTILNDPSANVGGLPLYEAIRNGALDAAYVRIERVFFNDAEMLTTPEEETYWMGEVAPILIFEGYVSDSAPGLVSSVLTVKSSVERLNTPIPKALMSPTCINQHWDSACALVREGYVVSGHITAVGEANIPANGGGYPAPAPAVMWETTRFRTDLTAADAYFSQGVLTMTSGAASGAMVPVESYTHLNGHLKLGIELPATPAIGDAFTICPGCDRTMGPGGCAKFNNLPNFCGMPFVPLPVTAR